VASVAQQPNAVDPLFLVHEASRQLHRREKLAKALIVAAILNGIAQLCWFSPKVIHQIDIDAMDYTGIAVELRHGLFHSAINGFRSPLISWLIAVIPGLSVFASGKLITISTFLLSGVLLYVLTRRLWDSKLVAATAVLLFSFSRGLEFCAVALISPDFLFTALNAALLHCSHRVPSPRQALVAAGWNSRAGISRQGLRAAVARRYHGCGCAYPAWEWIESEAAGSECGAPSDSGRTLGIDSPFKVRSVYYRHPVQDEFSAIDSAGISQSPFGSLHGSS